MGDDVYILSGSPRRRRATPKMCKRGAGGRWLPRPEPDPWARTSNLQGRVTADVRRWATGFVAWHTKEVGEANEAQLIYEGLCALAAARGYTVPPPPHKRPATHDESASS